MSASDSHDERTTTHPLQSASSEQMPIESNTSHTTSNARPNYRALEAAYLERGIRIQMDASTAAALNQQQTSTTDRSHGNKSTNLLQRPRAFVHRNPSRSSSALQYQVILPDPNEDGRPFSALQPGLRHDFERNPPPDEDAYANGVDLSQLTGQQLRSDYSTHSILIGEQMTPVTPPEQIRIPVNGCKSIDDDPDLVYMSKLLKTTNGDSFRGRTNRFSFNVTTNVLQIRFVDVLVCVELSPFIVTVTQHRKRVHRNRAKRRQRHNHLLLNDHRP